MLPVLKITTAKGAKLRKEKPYENLCALGMLCGRNFHAYRCNQFTWPVRKI